MVSEASSRRWFAAARCHHCVTANSTDSAGSRLTLPKRSAIRYSDSGWGLFAELFHGPAVFATVYLAFVSATAFALWNYLVQKYSAIPTRP